MYICMYCELLLLLDDDDELDDDDDDELEDEELLLLECCCCLMTMMRMRMPTCMYSGVWVCGYVRVCASTLTYIFTIHKGPSLFQ